ncbi:MAG: hypothetical protein QXX20_01130 [Candidatus Thermoplasmatota archaeon]
MILTVGVALFQIPAVKSNDPRWYEPTDITLLDNAYNITSYWSLQWWYFDALFTNNYSIHVGILSIGTQGKTGFFLLRISLYDHATIVARLHRVIPLRMMQFSPAEPRLQLQGKELLSTFYDAENHLCVSLNLSIKTVSANLIFISQIQGWKGYTGHGMWGCPVPRAVVVGTLQWDDTIFMVKGVGYQERGFDVRRFHKSWFWGKFSSTHFSIIFSQNMKNRWCEDFFLVMINRDTLNYTSIHRENIKLTHIQYQYHHGKLIPLESMFEIHEDDIDVAVRFSVQSIDFHMLGMLRYWRFHMLVTGTISIADQQESVNETQIMEYCHFW